MVLVLALGPSGRKAFYSNWGVEQADVAALFDYRAELVDALCEGTLQHNGCYGNGIVNALTASLC